MGVPIETETKLLHSNEDDNVKELLLAEMANEDGNKDAEEDELSDGSLSDDEEDDEEVVGIFNAHIDDQTRNNSTLSIVCLGLFVDAVVASRTVASRTALHGFVPIAPNYSSCQ